MEAGGILEEEIEEVMQAHKEFVPSREVTVPFMTILRERSYKESSVENLPFRSNFIYYVDQVLYAIQDLPDDKRPLKFNLKWDEAEQKRRDDLVAAHMALPEYADPGLTYTEGLTPVDDKIHEYLIENEQQGLERIDAFKNKVLDVSYKKQMFDDGVLLENSTKAQTVAGVVGDKLYYPRVALEKHFQNFCQILIVY